MRGFSAIQSESIPGGGNAWEVVDVHYGHSTDWTLQVRLERAGVELAFKFDGVVAYRAQDEGDMLGHWSIRDAEGLPSTPLYEIAASDYLTEFAEGVGGALAHRPLRHFVVAGTDLCVEVIATDEPTIAQQ